MGIEIEDDMIVLRREIQKVGKVCVESMENLSPLQFLREIGGTLVDIHGQHEHQELMDESKHLISLGSVWK